MTNVTKPLLKDRLIPWYFVAFFVVIAIVDGVFVTMATSTHRGVVTEQAYEKGLAYNSTIAQAEAQEELGWEGAITLDGSLLAFALQDKGGIAIEGAEIQAKLIRVLEAGHDFTVPLEEVGKGVYQANVSFPLKGQWHVRIEAAWNQQHYQQSQRIVVK